VNVHVRPLVVDWKGLRRLGWPYSRAQTHRLMAREIPDPKHRPKWDEKQRFIPNPDPFPQCYKLVNHRNAHPMWRLREVLAYFEAHGLAVSNDWQNS
jgi:hypothetical protein